MASQGLTKEAFEEELKTPSVFPGMYPKKYICADGAIMCHACAKENKEIILESRENRTREEAEWCIIAVEPVYEPVKCVNCQRNYG